MCAYRLSWGKKGLSPPDFSLNEHCAMCSGYEGDAEKLLHQLYACSGVFFFLPLANLEQRCRFCPDSFISPGMKSLPGNINSQGSVGL